MIASLVSCMLLPGIDCTRILGDTLRDCTTTILAACLAVWIAFVLVSLIVHITSIRNSGVPEE